MPEARRAPDLVAEHCVLLFGRPQGRVAARAVLGVVGSSTLRQCNAWDMCFAFSYSMGNARHGMRTQHLLTCGGGCAALAMALCASSQLSTLKKPTRRFLRSYCACSAQSAQRKQQNSLCASNLKSRACCAACSACSRSACVMEEIK